MRNLSKITLTALLASSLATPTVSAQWNVARFDEAAQKNRVYSTFGLDPAFIGTFGYARVVPVVSHAIQLTADVGMVAAKPDARDFRARIGTQTGLLRWRSLRVTGAATFITRGTENSIYHGFDFGADLTAAAGVYRSRWFAAGEFGKDKSIITHLTQSDWYRTNFYAAAKDGWYLDAGGTYHYGVTSGLTLGKTELVARFGFQRTERFNSLTVPMYASVGVGFGF